VEKGKYTTKYWDSPSHNDST